MNNVVSQIRGDVIRLVSTYPKLNMYFYQTNSRLNSHCCISRIALDESVEKPSRSKKCRIVFSISGRLFQGKTGKCRQYRLWNAVHDLLTNPLRAAELVEEHIDQYIN